MNRNNINGGSRSGGGGVLSAVDFYRRVPKDLTEATTLGASMSIMALITMAILFFSETIAFARTNIVTSIALDDNPEAKIRINFNITMLDLHCDYVSVDVLDSLGTNRQNVTKNVEKWQLDDTGTRRIFGGRNREQREVRHEEHDMSLEQMHENGVHAIPLTVETFPDFLRDNEMAFVNFFAPWCIWCQRLHPTWEKFAEDLEEMNMPVAVATVDCVTQSNLCREQRVMAFPQLRWFQGGQAVLPDYKMDRTVAALTGYAKRKLEMNSKFKNWQNDPTVKSRRTGEADRNIPQSRPEHPGCQVSGHLMVNRVPGNFHIEAKSVNHNLNAAMTNLTHVVNHLSFGDPLALQKRQNKRILKQVPEEHKQFVPMDDSTFLTNRYHQAYHHFIKVVSTHLDMGAYNVLMTYQFLEQSQVVYYDDMDVPEARFSYDISPMSVIVQKEGRKWYDYVTSLCAIIGGTFTTLGLIDASLYKVFKSKKL